MSRTKAKIIDLEICLGRLVRVLGSLRLLRVKCVCAKVSIIEYNLLY
jgi:hypothetical protein